MAGGYIFIKICVIIFPVVLLLSSQSAQRGYERDHQFTKEVLIGGKENVLGKLAKDLLAKGVWVDLEIFNEALVVKWMHVVLCS